MYSFFSTKRYTIGHKIQKNVQGFLCWDCWISWSKVFRSFSWSLNPGYPVPVYIQNLYLRIVVVRSSRWKNSIYFWHIVWQEKEKPLWNCVFNCKVSFLFPFSILSCIFCMLWIKLDSLFHFAVSFAFMNIFQTQEKEEIFAVFKSFLFFLRQQEPILDVFHLGHFSDWKKRC